MLISGICFGKNEHILLTQGAIFPGGNSYKICTNKPYRGEWIIAMHNGQICFRIHCTEKHFENLEKVTYQSCDCIVSVLLGLKCLSWCNICFFWNRLRIYLFLPPTIALLVRFSYYWPIVVLFVGLCVYIAYTRGTD